MKSTFLFIVADERTNAGEREYMEAIASTIGQHRKKDTEYLVYKIGDMAPLDGDATQLPLSHAGYALVSRLTDAALENITGFVKIMAVGQSTLPAALHARETLRAKGGTDVRMNYITHIIENANDLQKIVDADVTVFTPAPRSQIAEIDPQNAQGMLYRGIESVPRTNDYTLEHSENDRDGLFRANPAIQAMVDSGAPFIFVVLNAGFKTGEPAQWHPYTQDEAARHGAALGAYLPAGTNLILVDGGPRNLIDENEHGQKTMTAFSQAYAGIQPQAVVATDRFRQGLDYNAVKAGYALARMPQAVGYISNAEGNSTMDGAITLVDNRRKLLGMFPFASIGRDTTGGRAASTENYNRLGLAILEAGADNGLVIRRHQQEKTTPHMVRNAALDIVIQEGLAAFPSTYSVKSALTA